VSLIQTMLVVSKIIIVIIIYTRESARFGLSKFFFIRHGGGAVTRGFKWIRKNGLGRHNGSLFIGRCIRISFYSDFVQLAKNQRRIWRRDTWTVFSEPIERGHVRVRGIKLMFSGPKLYSKFPCMTNINWENIDFLHSPCHSYTFTFMRVMKNVYDH